MHEPLSILGQELVEIDVEGQCYAHEDAAEDSLIEQVFAALRHAYRHCAASVATVDRHYQAWLKADARADGSAAEMRRLALSGARHLDAAHTKAAALPQPLR
jgi:predicted RNA-binding protein with PIN domain